METTDAVDAVAETLEHMQAGEGDGELSDAELLAEAEAALDHEPLEGVDVDDLDDPAAVDAAELPDPGSPLPPAPGTELSPFRRCSCIGTLPGRACVSCNNTHWHKLCPAPGCNGSGILYKNSRTGWEPRSERCGFCMGRGMVPARAEEVRQAQEVYDLALEAQQRAGRVRLVTDDPEHVFRRRPILPKGSMTGGSSGNGNGKHGKPAKSRGR